MDFKNLPPDWPAKGVEPPQELKEKGWLAGYKPPASYWNWFQNKTYMSLKEIQEKLVALDPTIVKNVNGETPDSNGGVKVYNVFSQRLNAGDDLNDITPNDVVSFYNCPSSADAKEIKHTPFGSSAEAFCLEVYRGANHVQVYTQVEDNCAYRFIRSKNSSGTWGDWRRIAFWEEFDRRIKTLDKKIQDNWASHLNDVDDLTIKLNKKAPLDNPNLTGVPTAPTASKGTATDQIATTKFVDDIVGSIDFSALKNHTKYIENADLNTLVEDQAYYCVGTLENTPVQTSKCILCNYAVKDSNDTLQVAYTQDSTGNTRAFIRFWAKSGAVSRPWIEIPNKEYVDDELDIANELINQNKFRTGATVTAMGQRLPCYYLESFEGLDDLKAVKAGDNALNDSTLLDKSYLSRSHALKGTFSDSIIVLPGDPLIIENSLDSEIVAGVDVWGLLDWKILVDGAEAQLSIVNVTSGAIADAKQFIPVAGTMKQVSLNCVSGQNVFRFAIHLSGTLIFRNVAWGWNDEWKRLS